LDPARVGSCGHDIDELLHKRADGRLADEEATQLERRIAACASCRERADLLSWAVDSLHRDRRAVRAGLADEVMRRLAEREPPRSHRESPRPAAVLRWLPAAAVVALAVGAALVLRGGRTPPDTSSRIQVELQLKSPNASSVSVAGDWSGWDTVRMMRGEDGVFRVRLSLSPGRYQYAFLVDERTWVSDPRAATTLDSGYGGADSILDLTL